MISIRKILIPIFDIIKNYGIINMKDEKVWDYSQCQIGHPCERCTNTCSFKIKTFRLDKDADEKENKNERITERSEE